MWWGSEVSSQHPSMDAEAHKTFKMDAVAGSVVRVRGMANQHVEAMHMVQALQQRLFDLVFGNEIGHQAAEKKWLRSA